MNVERVLLNVSQDHKKLLGLALQPSKEALISNELTRHADMDVRVSVASCISEVIRITAPDEPYDEDKMKEYFQLANSAFESLSCMTGRAYSKAVSILYIFAYYKPCLMMLDLQVYEIVHQMFHMFLNGIRTDHSNDIFSSMVTIMTLIIQNNHDDDDCSLELAKILLVKLKKENQNVAPVAFQLAADTFKNCSDYLKPYLPEAARCLGIPVEDYAEEVASLFQDAAQRENMDNNDIGRDASCQGEAGLAIDDGLSNLPEAISENLINDANSNENRSTSSQYCDETENLSSQKQQEESKTENIPIPGKRTRKPNSLMKPEEGYDPLWMLATCTFMEDSCSRRDKRNKNSCPRKDAISKDSYLSSRPAGESSSAPNYQSSRRIKKRYLRSQGSSAKIPLDKKSRGKIINSEDLTGDITVKCTDGIQKRSKGKTIISEDLTEDIKTLDSQSSPTPLKGEAPSQKVSQPKHKSKRTASKEEKHLGKSQGSSTDGAPAKRSKGKTIISEDLTEDILIKTLDSQSSPTPLKGEAPSQKVSKPKHESKRTASKEEVSKIRDANKCFGEEAVGCRIKVWWPMDQMFYEGKITSFDQLKKMHQVDYDDGEHETLDLGKECWQLIGDDDLSTQEQKTVTTGASTETLSDRGKKSSHLSKRKKKEMWRQILC